MKTASRPFVHPAAMGRLDSRFFNDLVTIQTATEARSPTGEKTRTWVSNAAMTNLPARSVATPLEQRRGSFVGQQAQIEATHTIVVKQYLPTLRPDKNRVLLNGTAYDIRSVDWPEKLYTVIQARQLSSTGVNV